MPLCIHLQHQVIIMIDKPHTHSSANIKLRIGVNKRGQKSNFKPTFIVQLLPLKQFSSWWEDISFPGIFLHYNRYDSSIQQSQNLCRLLWVNLWLPIHSVILFRSTKLCWFGAGILTCPGIKVTKPEHTKSKANTLMLNVVGHIQSKMGEDMTHKF